MTVVVLIIAFSGYAQLLVGKRKRAEKERRESEERLQAILENSPTSIYIKDIEGRYTFVNRNSETVLGLTREQVLGKTDHDLFPKEMADAIRANDQRVLEANSPLSEEENILQGDEKRTNISTKFLLRDSEGSPYAICGISTDVTEQRQIREKLRESEARLVEAQQVARIGSWEMHLPTNTGIWSEELYRICGLEPQSQESTPFETFAKLIHPDDAEFVGEVIQKALDDHEPFAYDHRIIRPDGKVRTLHVQGKVLVDEASDPVRVVGTIQDVTEQRWARQESQLLRTVALEVSVAEDLDSALRAALQRVCEATG
ncbi:MAG: PAS domain S-box protein [Rubrobacter sp.]|nr:PAS domain S-box protein [Rubrobacter sp.]